MLNLLIVHLFAIFPAVLFCSVRYLKFKFANILILNTPTVIQGKCFKIMKNERIIEFSILKGNNET